MSDEQLTSQGMRITGQATAQMPVGDRSPVTVIGTPPIRATFDEQTLRQTRNTALAPGVDQVVLNPDAHVGFGAPIGCVLVSGSHIYPGPVGVDIKCSMSLLQTNIPAADIEDRRLRRSLIDAICERVPTGPGKGQRSVPKSRRIDTKLGWRAVVEGASQGVCERLGVPPEWAECCEDAFHRGHDGTRDALAARLNALIDGGDFPKFEEKIRQLGSYGGGNHFGECEVVDVAPDERAQRVAQTFGLRDGHVAFFSHCGSRGFGFELANHQFRTLQRGFMQRGREFPGGDKQLVFAELGTREADDYLDDMALGANFATVNHLLINSLVLEAFEEVLPGVQANFVYFISHNIARREPVGGRTCWVHRKGATRAFPAGHPQLVGTRFEHTGHPILLPGDPLKGSAVMAAEPGAELSCFSINHGAGRVKGRKAAFRELDQRRVDERFRARDVLTNCREYPRDEAPDVYKSFDEVVKSVELAGLARRIAGLRARFVIKDAEKTYGGAV